jgi:hypothetical protein
LVCPKKQHVLVSTNWNPYLSAVFFLGRFILRLSLKRV